MGLALDWLELSIRWVHVIAGIAWIGASFYFNWLNDRLAPPAQSEPGLVGELWSIHGGGFYRAMKYDTVPVATVSDFHWFKWEAYLTWISGVSLLILVYYLAADVYLIDADSPVGAGAAIAIGAGVLVGGWLVYDRLCRTPLAARSVWFAALGLVLVTGLAFALTRVFGPRAAYMHIGAMIGTMMAANVFFVIIPAHRELVAAVQEGREPDRRTGEHAALRSRHNNYLTLPVLFVMISAHYPMTYGHAWSWGILAGLFVVGGLTRHGFNLRNAGRGTGLVFPIAASALVALAVVSAGGGGSRVAITDGAVTYERVREILAVRCIICHAAEPADALFDSPPGGIILERPEDVAALSDRIEAVTVNSRVMPLGNFTGMTDEERAELGRWIADGARIDGRE